MESFNIIPIPNNVDFRFHEDVVVMKAEDKEKRKTYKIRNNHIKDLLALAKSQASKLSSFSQDNY